MKPSTKARTTTKAPAARKPAARKPATKPTANPKPDETASDAATAPPAPPEVVTAPAPPAQDVAPPPSEPEAVDQAEAPADAPQDEPAETPVEPEAPSEPEAATSAAPETVQIGEASCPVHRVPLEDVLGVLGQPVLDRIHALKGHASIQPLVERMRATDGRCAPVYFTHEGVGKDVAFNHGAETIAAAIELGDNDIFVVMVPAEEAEALQDHVVKVTREEQAKAAKR